MEFHGKSKKDALVEMVRKLGADAEIESITSVSLDGARTYKVSASAFPGSEISQKKSGYRGLFIFAALIIILAAAGYFAWPWISSQLFPQEIPPGTYEPTIAVMPFKNVGEGDDYPHFGEGLAEDLISGLINLKGLKIISRNSSFAADAREQTPVSAGSDLGVATLLKGTYRIDSGKVKIVASLIDTSDGSYIWTKTYDHELKDVFKIQEQISQQIIQEMRLELGLQEKDKLRYLTTANSDAWNSFHAGWYYLDQRTREGFKKAEESFNETIEVDPTFARAYYGLAFSLYLQGSYNYSPPIPAFERALIWAEKAIEVDDTLGEAYAVRAMIRRDLKLDWEGAEEDFLKALELSPGSARTHHWYGNFLGDLGRFKEAESQLLQAKELAPISKQINLDIAVSLIDRLEYDKALEHLKLTVQMFPDFRGAHHLYLVTLFRRGYLKETLAEYKRFNKAVGQTEASSKLEELFYEKGFFEASKQFLIKFGDTIGPHEKAALYMVLGDGEKAIDYLEKAFAIRSGRVFHLKSEPVFVPLHDHPRFKALLKKMNLQ